MQQSSHAFNPPRLSVIGAGRLGTVLARAFSQAGWLVVACASRTAAHAERLAQAIPGCQACELPAQAAALADWVFLTVPDDAIAAVAASVPWQSTQTAVHCSGARPAAIMQAAAQAGAHLAGFHPLQTFAEEEAGLAHLTGTTVGIEADDARWDELAALARAIGASPLRIGPEQRALYHLGSVVVSNFTVGLVALAVDLWREIGIEGDTTVAALLPLLQGTVDNITALGPAAALTGPAVRGDIGTIVRHAAALQEHGPALDVYRALTEVLVALAQGTARLNADQAAALRHALADTAAGPQTLAPAELPRAAL